MKTRTTISAPIAAVPEHASVLDASNVISFPAPRPEENPFSKFEKLGDALGGDRWQGLGTICRIAWASDRLDDRRLSEVMDELLEEAPDLIVSNFYQRRVCRKVLREVLVLLRRIDRRENALLDGQLDARSL